MANSAGQDFGSGLGQIIGSGIAANDLSNASNSVTGTSSVFGSEVGPYNAFGQSFLPRATQASDIVASFANNTDQSYNDFMKSYQTSPGAAYEMKTADEAQNESAAAKGGLLSGTNERELSNINQGISNMYANQAYSNYLKGNEQQFGQLESVFQNMLGSIGVGTTATGQIGTLDASQNAAQANIAAAQAKNDQSKGSGFGSLFSGLGSFATMF